MWNDPGMIFGLAGCLVAVVAMFSAFGIVRYVARQYDRRQAADLADRRLLVEQLAYLRDNKPWVEPPSLQGLQGGEEGPSPLQFEHAEDLLDDDQVLDLVGNGAV